jgi:OmpA-OmpF porin, OOP family
MRNGIIPKIITLLFCIIFSGCVDHAPPVVENTAIKTALKGYHKVYFEEYQPVDTEGYVKKVDNFTIIFDPSASMTQSYMPSYDCIVCHIDYQDTNFAERHAIKYGGREFAKKDKKQFAMDCNLCHQNQIYNKFEFAKSLTKSLNQSIPKFDLTGTLRTFGYPVYTNFHYGLKRDDNKYFLKYNKNEYRRAIDKILEADGVSPLHLTLDAVAKDWYNKKGKIAIIIISDGLDMDEREFLSAEDLKARYGEDICIYTILIGNDPSGRRMMNRIALAGQCGVAIDGDQLLDKERMEDFVREVFLANPQPGTGYDNGDEDGDGVPDCRDDCPGTKPGLTVDKNGCWHAILQGDVLFDFDKQTLKPEGIIALGLVFDYLNNNPLMDLHISGHTDNFGTMEYNIRLSKRRAQAGLNYLVKKGIDPKRISISWHSFSIPVATNDNPAGRALNRRLEFNFNKQQN